MGRMLWFFFSLIKHPGGSGEPRRRTIHPSVKKLTRKSKKGWNPKGKSRRAINVKPKTNEGEPKKSWEGERRKRKTSGQVRTEKKRKRGRERVGEVSVNQLVFEIKENPNPSGKPEKDSEGAKEEKF